MAAWAVHSGGRKVLDVVGERLGIDEHGLDAYRESLAVSGNTSSATVLLTLGRILTTQALEPGDPVVLLAFRPGSACTRRCYGSADEASPDLHQGGSSRT